MTETDLQRVVIFPRHRRAFVLPNYTPRRWWECDVFEVTAAGYFREYEVKLTLGDFKADRKKWRERWQRPAEQKHERLAHGDSRGPTRFWFVTPRGLLFLEAGPRRNPEAVLPAWAGLIEVEDLGEEHSWWWRRYQAKEVRVAPRLHKEKFGDGRLAHAKSVVYYRFYDLFWGTRENPPSLPGTSAGAAGCSGAAAERAATAGSGD